MTAAFRLSGVEVIAEKPATVAWILLHHGVIPAGVTASWQSQLRHENARLHRLRHRYHSNGTASGSEQRCGTSAPPAGKSSWLGLSEDAGEPGESEAWGLL